MRKSVHILFLNTMTIRYRSGRDLYTKALDKIVARHFFLPSVRIRLEIEIHYKIAFLNCIQLFTLDQCYKLSCIMH